MQSQKYSPDEIAEYAQQVLNEIQPLVLLLKQTDTFFDIGTNPLWNKMTSVINSWNKEIAEPLSNYGFTINTIKPLDLSHPQKRHSWLLQLQSGEICSDKWFAETRSQLQRLSGQKSIETSEMDSAQNLLKGEHNILSLIRRYRDQCLNNDMETLITEETSISPLVYLSSVILYYNRIAERLMSHGISLPYLEFRPEGGSLTNLDSRRVWVQKLFSRQILTDQELNHIEDLIYAYLWSKPKQ